MIRKAFVMSVNEGSEAEYERRHNPIPEDLARALKEGGAHNYSIFLDAETNLLFAYVEIEDEAQMGCRLADGSLPPMVGADARRDALEPGQQPRRPRSPRGVPPGVRFEFRALSFEAGRRL